MSPHAKPDTEAPIHDLIAARWSPRAFEQRAVEPEKLRSMIEAARWAPSCFNDQPWSFLIAHKDDRAGFDKLAQCLADGNAWAKQAPVLALTVARLNFDRNGKPNRHAYHDVGLAVENLALQAVDLGLAVHQMGGFDAEQARRTLSIPDDHDPVAMLAIGYEGSPDALDDDLRQKEVAARSRKDAASFVFGPDWGSSPTALGL